MACAISACSFATVKLSLSLPWSGNLKNTPVVLFFGLGIAPFLFGFLGILELSLLAGASHNTHLTFMLGSGGFLAACAYAFLPKQSQGNRTLKPKAAFSLDEKIALFLIIAYLLGLVANVVLSPLTQNDSLEYATAARILYDTGNLADYPALDSQKYSSGFYGPWTHPPLYASIIYNSYLLQGNADMPGFMRIISPWFTLLSVGIIYALGSLINRRVGLFSALLFFSTPILFLGTDSALIDSLPILGLLLIITSIIGIETTAIKSGLIQGSILGMALWTHSQALLFIPISLACIFIFNGIYNWRLSYRQSFIFILVAISIAAFPYIRNLSLFGSLISDTNIVYALPQMKWGDYFSIGRGLDSVTAIIQYGIFKGWFVPEYYSLSFWIMSFGVIYFFARYSAISVIKNALGGIKNDPVKVIVLALAILLIYLGGVILSVIMGIDLMIRNERYILVILPFVSLIGGWFVASCTHSSIKSKIFNTVRIAFISVVACFVSVQLVFFVAYRLNFTLNQGFLASIFEEQDKKLRLRPEMLAMDFLRLNTAQNSLVLSLKPADMYYSHRKMVSYLDPRLVKFYATDNMEEGLSLLKEIGINYIYLPDYSLPPFYNSILHKIIADTHYSTLQFSIGGFQIYKLEDSGLQKNNILDISPGIISWVRINQILYGGEKAGIKTPNSKEILKNKELLISHSPFNLFQKNISNILTTAGPTDEIPGISQHDIIKVNGGGEYLLEIKVKGKGLLDFFVLQFDEMKNVLHDGRYRSSDRTLIGNLILGKDADNTIFMRRIKILPDTRFLRLEIEQHGNSEIRIEKVNISELIKKDNANE